ALEDRCILEQQSWGKVDRPDRITEGRVQNQLRLARLSIRQEWLPGADALKNRDAIFLDTHWAETRAHRRNIADPARHPDQWLLVSLVSANVILGAVIPIQTILDRGHATRHVLPGFINQNEGTYIILIERAPAIDECRREQARA